MYSWFDSGRELQFWITAHCLNAWILLGYDQGVFAGIPPECRLARPVQQPERQAHWRHRRMSYVSGPIAWRLPLAMQIVFSLIEMVSVLCVPESPRWLYTVGRQVEAVQLLCLATG
jgi:hypothetical protein